MNARLLFSVLKWGTALGLLCGLLAGAYFVNTAVQQERGEEGERDKVDSPRRAENGVVNLGAELTESQGIKDEEAEAVSWHPRVAVYGRVVPNPQATVEIRSAFSGILRADPETPWPAAGRTVAANRVLGWVEVRVGPQDRLDLQAKVNEARHKQQGAEEVVKIQEERVGRLEKATTSQGIPRRDLDDALVALAEARTQAAVARGAVELWQKALAGIERGNDRKGSVWSEPFKAPMAGEVTELAARPGTAIEAGGLIARVVDFTRPLVRLDFPAEALLGGPPAKVEMLAASPMSAPLGNSRAPEAGGTTAVGHLVGPAPHVEAVSQLSGYWYEVHPESKTGWRPGLFVKASVPATGEQPREAVAVARSALLFHQGRTLVYVRTEPGRFERREVKVLGQQEGRWVLASGVAAGEPVVTRQAQLLLSEEFRGDVDSD